MDNYPPLPAVQFSRTCKTTIHVLPSGDRIVLEIVVDTKIYDPLTGYSAQYQIVKQIYLSIDWLAVLYA